MNRLAVLVSAVCLLLIFWVLELEKPPEPEPEGPALVASTAQVGEPVPLFRLSRLDQPATEFSPATMRGQVWLLNVWASWCTPCREELPTLSGLSAQVAIVGLNYKDPREKGLAWLGRHGNPYQLSAHDVEGKVGTVYQLRGVPETFVIDKKGVIRLRHAGPVTDAMVREQLLPLISELKRG